MGLVAVYLLPTLIGLIRGVDRMPLVFLVNLIGAPTGIGWWLRWSWLSGRGVLRLGWRRRSARPRRAVGQGGRCRVARMSVSKAAIRSDEPWQGCLTSTSLVHFLQLPGADTIRRACGWPVLDDAAEFGLWLSPHILASPGRVLARSGEDPDEEIDQYLQVLAEMADVSGGGITDPAQAVGDCDDWEDVRRRR